MSDTNKPVDYSKYLNSDTLELLTDLMDGDSEMLIDLVDTLIDTTPQLLDDLKAGVATKDPQKIRNSAHALKSSNAQLGAEAFASMCEEMESKGRAEDTTDLDILYNKIISEFDVVCEALGAWKMSLV